MGKWGQFKRSGITQEKLQELYEDHTDEEIASMYGVSDASVRRVRWDWGIETKAQWERKKKPSMRSFGDLTPVILEELSAQMGDRQVGALYGVSKTLIRKRRLEWGIRSRSKSERATKTTLITPEQKAIVIGTVLGDGHLLERGVLKVDHAYHQLSYLRWVHGSLRPLSRPVYYSEKIIKSTGVLCFGFGFRTVQHIWLKGLRKLFYPQGIKVFPEPLLKELSPLSLAVWYFDDGHLGAIPSFALGDISEQEAEKVCSLVKERFGLQAYLSPKSAKTCKIMGIRAISSDIFFHLIRDYATPDMCHKIPPKYWSRGASLHRSFKTPSQDPTSSDLRDRSRQWKFLGDSEKDDLLNTLVSFWQEEGFPYHQPRPEELEVLMELTPDHILKKDVLRPRQVGQAICQAFAKHIWEARSAGSPESPLEIFHNKTSLRRALKAWLSMSSSRAVTAGSVRSAVRMWKLSGVYNFRPSAAKVLTDRFCRPGGVVFDPCAGYGGRLLGALLSSSSPRYVGCDPNKEGIVRLGHLVKWLSGYLPGIGDRVELYDVPAEDFEIPLCDMVLTSPPYWRREEYDDDPRQSFFRYPTYEVWLEGFWATVLRRAVKALRPGGWVVLNVDDFILNKVAYSLIGDTSRICRGLGLGEPEVFQYHMPRFSSQGNHEKVLAFVKPGETRVPKGKPPGLVLSRCSECGGLHPGEEMIQGLCRGCHKARGYPFVCEQCGKPAVGKRKDRRFCSDNCASKSRYRRKRLKNPPKGTYTYTCKRCGGAWEEKTTGRYRFCPACKEQREAEKRIKVCAYRHCGREFEDTSMKNGMGYCHVEHRRREKLFRSGKAKSLSYFRKPDPV